MVVELDLTWTGPRRHAFLLRPEIVRILLPPGYPGVYLLLDLEKPVYVGRSDMCLRERLAFHELSCEATHFTWHICPAGPWGFYLESAEFHRLEGFPGFLNQIHPRHPEGFPLECPFCSKRDHKALAQALSKKQVSVASNPEGNSNSPDSGNVTEISVHSIPLETQTEKSPLDGRGGRASTRSTPDRTKEDLT